MSETEHDSPETSDTGPEAEAAKRRAAERRSLGEAERMHLLRERLYARDRESAGSIRHPLDGGESHEPLQARVAAPMKHADIPPRPTPPPAVVVVEQKETRRRYRSVLTIFALAFFVGALIVAGVFLYFGKNTVSDNNITVGMSGPLTVGGGQSATFQVAIANQNNVSAEGVTLVVNYPQGTQSADGSGKQLTTERRPLNSIAPHETINVPVSAIFFGEQNEERQIRVSIEYRLSGANATFSKDADPLSFKIGSSPVTITVDTVKSISSGQQADIKLTISSNSPTPLTDLLVKATYPAGFNETKAEPNPTSGQDSWLFSTLKPNTEATITIHGTVTGNKNDIPHFSFAVGVPSEQDRYSLASTLASASADISIEQPFLGVIARVNGDTGDTIVADSRGSIGVSIDLTNTLDMSIYDAVIKANVTGSAVSEGSIRADTGFYDSKSQTVSWDISSMQDLKELAPGSKTGLGFSITPDKRLGSTPEIVIKITVEGKRVSHDNVPQQLSDIVSKTIKIESSPKFGAVAVYSEGPFTNTGPVPPVAEKVTQYTFLLTADGGFNDLTNGEMTAVLPQYISWLDLVSEGADVTYNPSSRTMKWNIGNVTKNAHKEAWVQVSFLPSTSQVGTTPTVLKNIVFKATDRFTGTVLDTSLEPLTTELNKDPDPTKHGGIVVLQ